MNLKKKMLACIIVLAAGCWMPLLEASLLFEMEGTVPSPIVPGQGLNGFNRIPFNFILQNTGSTQLTEINVSIFLGRAGLSEVTLTQTPAVFPNLTYANGFITGSGGTLAVAQTVTISGTFTLPCNAVAGPYTVQGFATAHSGTTLVQTTLPPAVGTVDKTITLGTVDNYIILDCLGSYGETLLVNFSGGMGPYSVIIKDVTTGVVLIESTLSSPLFLENLVNEHTYTVQITDVNGCATPVSAQILNGPAATPAFCPDALNGTISFFVGGGSNSYKVAIKGETTGFTPTPIVGGFGTQFLFSGLPADTYDLSITDLTMRECDVTIPAAAIVGSNGLTITASGVAPDCFGASNGSIIVSVTTTSVATGFATVTATPTFTSAAPCPQAPITVLAPLDGTPVTLLGFQGGTYEVSAAVDNCLVSTSVAVPAQPELIVNSLITTNQTCPGIDDGTVTITVAGNGPFTFTLCNSAGKNCSTSPSTNSSFIFPALAPGAYQIYATDKNGCMSETYPVTIAAAVPISATAVGLPPSCAEGSDGIIVITATGGTGTLVYSLLTPPIGPQTSNIITGLAAGTYSALVTDQNGCTFTLSDITVPAPAPIVITYSIKPISCPGAHDAVITVTSESGGTQPVLFTLDQGVAGQQQGPQSGKVFFGVGPGMHTITVSDDNTPPCSITVTTPLITDPTPLSVSALAIPTLCFGQPNGKVFVTPTGGTPPYLYSINGGATFGSQTEFTGLPAHTYSVIVKDAHKCTATTTATVIQPSPLAFGSITQKNVSCFLGNDGAITFTGSGGAGGYSFAIDGGSFSSQNTFTGLAAGLHTIMVKDMNGCTEQGFVELTQPPKLLVAAFATQPSGGPCSAQGVVEVIAQGGVMPYIYTISGRPAQSFGIFNTLAQGSYSVTVEDANGCSVIIPVQVP